MRFASGGWSRRCGARDDEQRCRIREAGVAAYERAVAIEGLR